MKNWLKKHYINRAIDWWDDKDTDIKNPFYSWICQTAFADPWPDEVEWATKRLIKEIKFPTKKPAAFLTIDDRAICFNGNFQDPKELLKFKPWNKIK